jgi:hypothetical protein
MNIGKSGIIMHGTIEINIVKSQECKLTERIRPCVLDPSSDRSISVSAA